MGCANMFKTMMLTGYQLLTSVCFHLMAVSVLAGGAAGLLSEFGVIALINRVLRPVIYPLYGLPGSSALGIMNCYLSDNPAILAFAQDDNFKRYFKKYQMAALTNLGTAFGMAAIPLFPAYHLDAGTFAIAGMGALLAASVRAPLTGIVLVLEMTDNYQLILPMIITCLGATLLAQFLGGKPLYSTILQRTLAKQEAEQAAKAQQAPRENT